MKKNSILILILFCVIGLQAQNPFSMRGVFGIATIDDKVWGQFALRPTIDVWKLKFGLDIVMYIDQMASCIRMNGIFPAVQRLRIHF